MSKGRPSARVVGKYTLFQIPGLLLLAAALSIFDHWLPIPVWVWLAVLGGWAIKDALIFPFVWRSFDDGHRGYPYSPVGLIGVALEPLAPAGRIRVRGERWQAELGDGVGPIPAGASVRVTASRGLVLLVEPSDE
jgi:membrane protein implicated in regulation of membrane protease activity